MFAIYEHFNVTNKLIIETNNAHNFTMTLQNCKIYDDVHYNRVQNIFLKFINLLILSLITYL